MTLDDERDERSTRRGCDAFACVRCSDGPCPLDGLGGLAPYRLVARYRGDRVGRSFRPQTWEPLGQLADDDPSWPPARPN